MTIESTVRHQLIKDIGIILLSLIVAYGVMKSPLVDTIARATGGWYILTAFASGLFFTSVFTTAPAIAVLAKLSVAHNPFIIAVVGGFGAYFGDLIIFRFLKDHLAANILTLIESRKNEQEEGRLSHLFHQRYFRWSLAFLGALIIASPFPDEIGLALMGLSDVSPKRFALISLSFNTIGILVIAFVARAAV